MRCPEPHEAALHDAAGTARVCQLGGALREQPHHTQQRSHATFQCSTSNHQAAAQGCSHRPADCQVRSVYTEALTAR